MRDKQKIRKKIKRQLGYMAEFQDVLFKAAIDARAGAGTDQQSAEAGAGSPVGAVQEPAR